MNPTEKQTYDRETQKQDQKPELGKKGLKPGTIERKKVGELSSRNPEITKSKAELLKTVENREVTKEKFDRARILDSNIKLTKGDIPEAELKKRIELVKVQQMKEADLVTLSQEELEEKALEQLTIELGEKGREALVQKRVRDYDKEETFKIKDKDGNEVEITETQFEHLQRENPEIKQMVEKIQPELSKELLAIYGEDKILGYADVLAEKGIKTLEEAEKIIKQETLKRAKAKIQTDKDGNPLSEDEKAKIAEEIERNMNSDPKYASEMVGKMAGIRGISETQAHNVQPEALNLSGTVRDRTLNLIKHFEGFTSKAFWDYKQWTRGYGTKAPGGGISISKEQATQQLEKKVNTHYGAEHVFGRQITDKLGPNQIAVLTSYLFNTGVGKAKKLRGPLQNYVNGGSIEPVLKALSGPRTAGGKILEGLVKRRKTEVKLFREGEK